MDKFLDVYGNLPEDLGLVEIDTSEEEMCFVQYLPVILPLQENLSPVVPDNLKWCESLIGKAAIKEYLIEGNAWRYVYITVKRLYGSGNREGWHCDGFGTEDINYIWYDNHPTEFYPFDMTLPHCHEESMNKMEKEIDDRCTMITYPCKHLLRMDQSSIHRVNKESFTGLRTFVKISFSNEKYNLKGNAHNYLLDYKWEMVERDSLRNHPSINKVTLCKT